MNNILSPVYPANIEFHGVEYTNVVTAVLVHRYVTDWRQRAEQATLTADSAVAKFGKVDTSDDYIRALIREVTYYKFLQNEEAQRVLMDTPDEALDSYLLYAKKWIEYDKKLPTYEITPGVSLLFEFPYLREENFNVKIYTGVQSLNGLLSGCKRFNGRVEFMTDDIPTVSSIFDKCASFNRQVILPDGARRMSGTFNECYAFDSFVHLPNEAEEALGVFTYCRKFNKPVTVPPGVKNVSFMFSSTTLFNQPVDFTQCKELTSMEGCFMGANGFNQPIEIPESVTSIANMFNSALVFNSPVIANGQNLKYAQNAFKGAFSFNQSFYLFFVERADSIFEDCMNLTEQCGLNPYAVSLRNAYRNCRKYYHDIYVSKNTDIEGIVIDCPYMTGKVKRV